MSTFVITCATINQDDPTAYSDYLSVAMPLLEKVGARIFQQFDTAGTVADDQPTERIVVVQYPDIDAVHSLYESDEYRTRVIPIRNKAFSSFNLSIVGQ